ncbi:MAG: hypothetical protein Kow0090_04920 [Myxococcota bacterium]
MTATSKNKVLRIGVIQGGKIKEERLVKKREDVSVGRGQNNTFIIEGKDIPESFTLFSLKGNQYFLNFTDKMQGRVSVNNSNVDFDSLKTQGLVKKSGDIYSLALQQQSRGKVSIEDNTILFQFVTPPPEPAKLTIPSHASSYWMKNIASDKTFSIIFLASVIIHIAVVNYISSVPYPKGLSFDKIPDRFAKILMPEKPEEKPKEEAPKQEEMGTKKTEEAKKTEGGDETDEERLARKRGGGISAEARAKAAGAGILKILTVDGPGGSSALANVFGQGGVTGDLDSAMAGIGGIGVATSGDVKSTFGGGTGTASTIEDIGTTGARGASQDLGTGKSATIRGSIKTTGPIDVDGSLSPQQIARVVKSRLSAVQNCYETALKRNPKLQGKIVIAFTIAKDGRVKGADVESSTISDPSVASCIISRLRHWRFPAPDGGEVTASYPFIFSPAQ